MRLEELLLMAGDFPTSLPRRLGDTGSPCCLVEAAIVDGVVPPHVAVAEDGVEVLELTADDAVV